MNILLVTSYFPPDNGSAANLFHDLAHNLSDKGNEVTVLTTIPQYHSVGNLDKYKKKIWITEKKNKITIHRIYCPRFEGMFKIGRGLWQIWVSLALSLGALFLNKKDICLVYSPPLPLCLSGFLLNKFKGTKVILNIQDLVPQSIIDLGMLKNHSLIQIFKNLEQFSYKYADHITVMSQGNLEHVTSQGVENDKVSIIENWVNIPDSQHKDMTADILHKYSLSKSKLITFGGVLGHSQDLDIIINAARTTASRTDLLWLIVGDGAQKEYLLNSIKKYALSNIKVLPMLERQEYDAILANSYLGLATLKPIVKTPVVPSKIYSIMSAGIPVLCAMDLAGDAPKLIKELNCGVNILPGDYNKLAKSAIHLVDNEFERAKLGGNGLNYIKNNLNVSSATIKYQELFANLLE